MCSSHTGDPRSGSPSFPFLPPLSPPFSYSSFSPFPYLPFPFFLSLLLPSPTLKGLLWTHCCPMPSVTPCLLCSHIFLGRPLKVRADHPVVCQKVSQVLCRVPSLLGALCNHLALLCRLQCQLMKKSSEIANRQFGWLFFPSVCLFVFISFRSALFAQQI